MNIKFLLSPCLTLLLISCVSTVKPKVTQDVLSLTGPNVYVQVEDTRPEAPRVEADTSGAPLMYQGTEVVFAQDVRVYVKEMLEAYMVKRGYGIAPSPEAADIVISGRVFRFKPRLGMLDWHGVVELELKVNGERTYRTIGQGAVTNWGTTNTANYACDALDEALAECFSTLEPHLK